MAINNLDELGDSGRKPKAELPKGKGSGRGGARAGAGRKKADSAKPETQPPIGSEPKADSTEKVVEKNGFTLAPEVEKVARKLIFDRSITRLESQRFIFMHNLKVPKSGGKKKYSNTMLLNARHSFLTVVNSLVGDEVVESTERIFAIEISKPVWDKCDEDTRKKLVFDALCRCGVDEQTKRQFIKKPDFEGFFESVRLDGFWHEELRSLAEVAKPWIPQLTLIDTDAPEDDTPAE